MKKETLLPKIKRMLKSHIELKLIFFAVLALFVFFLAAPIAMLLLKSFQSSGGAFWTHYIEVFRRAGFWSAVGNSFLAAGGSALITTILAFLLAYTICYTNLPKGFLKMLRTGAVLPMLLPTITYGFALIYTFGKQGLLTRILGHQLFPIYGLPGLLIGYVIYTLPVAFLLIHNTMGYIDKKFMIVSSLMGDKKSKTFLITILRPLSGTLAAAFIQSFFLAFTDFGIPASVGGQYEVLASLLYDEMLGSIPDFNKGAVIAMVMLVPSVLSILLLHYLERYNVRYNKISAVENEKNRARDLFCGISASAILLVMLLVFAVIFLVPFMEEWPYRLTFTTAHVAEVFQDSVLAGVFYNSLLVAFLTACTGSLVAYGAALVTARSKLPQSMKHTLESIALVTNTVPGMVIGIAFLLTFSGTSLQNTFLLMILCNVVHYFSTPYLMMKSSLEKMNASWETTAMLMGDNWMKTIFRVVTPNALPTLLEVFSYYFINAMVTVSAVIFIAGAKTMVITTKIKELQHFAEFNKIFVLSLCILFTNLAAKGMISLITVWRKKTKEKQNVSLKNGIYVRRIALAVMALIVLYAGAHTWFGQSETEQPVVIYSNADDEAVTAIKHALDENGYEGRYLFQTFGTSELGGKLMAEGASVEADLVTMSSFYLDSAQTANEMFADLTFSAPTLEPAPSYYRPITSQEGAIFINTEELDRLGLPVPTSIKDLADPVYANEVSVTDIKSSSTAWLLIQALLGAYEEDEAQEILSGIYQNAGPHLEDSGSGPIKKVRSGEVAVGFGLRHQAVADQKDGMPILAIDPTEGNYSLTESVAVIEKEQGANPLAMEMAECIVTHARAELQQTYPNPLYEGETVNETNQSAHPSKFPEPLTADLLARHQEFSERCKK